MPGDLHERAGPAMAISKATSSRKPRADSETPDDLSDRHVALPRDRDHVARGSSFGNGVGRPLIREQPAAGGGSTNLSSVRSSCQLSPTPTPRSNSEAADVRTRRFPSAPAADPAQLTGSHHFYCARAESRTLSRASSVGGHGDHDGSGMPFTACAGCRGRRAGALGRWW